MGTYIKCKRKIGRNMTNRKVKYTVKSLGKLTLSITEILSAIKKGSIFCGGTYEK